MCLITSHKIQYIYHIYLISFFSLIFWHFFTYILNFTAIILNIYLLFCLAARRKIRGKLFANFVYA